MGHIRPIVATLLGLGLAVSAAGAVMAKGEAAKLTLDDPLPVDAPPGSEVVIAWTLGVMTGEGTTEPFSAEGVYVRLTPASGSPVEVIARQDRTGHYIASVTVPSGGLGAVVIGLQGSGCLASGECTRADEIFMTAKAGSRGGTLPVDPVAEPPTAVQPAPQPAAMTPAPATTVALDPAVVLLAVLGGAGILGALVIFRRSRPATA
jgi:hypothetical protein